MIDRLIDQVDRTIDGSSTYRLLTHFSVILYIEVEVLYEDLVYLAHGLSLRLVARADSSLGFIYTYFPIRVTIAGLAISFYPHIGESSEGGGARKFEVSSLELVILGIER